MSTAKRLVLIAAGYVLAVVAGFAAVTLNELRMPADVAQGSPGMVAFGDMILFVLVTGFFGLVPTVFLLKLLVDKAPRALLVVVLLVAVLGPASWLAVRSFASGPSPPSTPGLIMYLLGPFIAFIGIPRMVFGPVMLVIEGATFVLLRGRVVRGLLAVAMLMDLVPLGLFALHMMRAAHRY
jgi:hypothetical protein